ncbi:hypothetical protein NKH77_40045 [Streptomyces sp. M19]
MFVSRPAEDGTVHVTVGGGGDPLEWRLAPGDHDQKPHGPYEVSVRRAAGGEPPAVEVAIATVPSAPDRLVLPLDAVYDQVTVGGWVTVERPRKGAEGPTASPATRRWRW